MKTLKTASAGARPADNRPTGSKVRHSSRRAGEGPFVVLNWDDANQRIRALHRWERRQKKRPGHRNRAVGHVGVAVYEYLARRAVKTRGRLDDQAYEAIAAIVGFARSAVVAACERLKRFGWLNWRRQYAPTGERGQRGPQVEQTFNLFWICAPIDQLVKLGIRLGRPPVPDGDESTANLATSAAMEFADSRLGRATARLGAAVSQRETSKRPDSMGT